MNTRHKQKNITDLKETIQMEISLIKAEIAQFQNRIRGSDGKLSKSPRYPKEMTIRIGQLKNCGISAQELSILVGVSRATIFKWFKASEKIKTPSEVMHKSTNNNIKELKILDLHKDKIKNTPVDYSKYVDKQTARIIFKSGVIIEISEFSVLQNLSVWINAQSTNINGELQ